VTFSDLPLVNATLNGVSTGLLIAAFIAIKTRWIRTHASLIIGALVTSAAFLTCYVIYHCHVGDKSRGEMLHLPRWLRSIYLSILFPHILLAVVMVPMIVTALWRAWRRDWVRHHRIAAPTYWVWLYVSVTGVVIYWMLYHLFPRFA
jgi:uncharacterized membrane protein YozB (DUF420 family)